jgi:type IX secretion system PorP/SprF family membrane protein
MKNLILTFVLFILVVTSGIAQQTPFSSQYYSNQFVTNPALTGNKGTTNVFLTHRTQWVGISGSPQTSYFTIDGAVKQKGVGLGLTMFSDVTDILSRSGANVSYSYKLNINTDNSLTFGLALGVINNKVNFTKAVVLDVTDPFLVTQQIARTMVNADFGLAYNWKKLEVGFAVPQLLGNSIRYLNNQGATGTYNLARHYYTTLKYVFDVSTSKEITAYPLFMLRNVAGAPTQFDINGVIDWKKYGWFGVTYHSDYAVAFSFGARYKNLSVGYAYDLGISRIKKYTGTTSEFLLSYNFGKVNDSEEFDLLKNKVLDLQQKDSVNTIKLNDLIVKDSLKDSLLLKLQNLSDTNKVEIERLKARLDKLNATDLTKVSTPSNGDSNNNEAELKKKAAEKAEIEAELAKLKSKEDSTKLAILMTKSDIPMKTAQSNEFSSQGGGDAKAGYYVIIGAFSNEANAKIFTKDAKKKGYKTAEIIQNKKNQIFEIVVFKTQNREPAIEKLEGIKSDYPDVWVLTLE